MFEDTFARIGQFFQLAVVIAQQLPRDLLESREQTQHLIDNPGEWGPRLRETFAENAQPKEEVEDLGWIELDPVVSFGEQLQRGNYKGGVHPDITADMYKLNRKVRRRIVLYNPIGFVSTEAMERRIKQNGDRPCCLDDALGVGYKFPDRQRKNPLVCLGEDSVCLDDGGNECAPVLDEWDGRRGLDLNPLVGGWSGRYRFPAVREEEYSDA